jgi:hypothetical protein
MLTDSKKKELSPEAIIMIAAQQTSSPNSAEAVYAAIVKEINLEGVSTYREGNTIFIIHHVKNRIGFFRVLNADTPRNFVDNSNSFTSDAYDMGLDVLMIDFRDPTIMNIFKAISRNPPREGMGYRAEKTKNGFRVTVKLGPARPMKE